VRIAIIGTGAIGCLFGAILKKGGRDVVLLGRCRETVEAIQNHGVVLEEQGAKESVRLSVFLNPAEAGTADIAILAVKAYDTKGALPSVVSLLGKDGAVLTLQNGIGNAQILAGTLGADRVLLGTTAHGSNVVFPGHVRHAGVGDTLLGETSGACSQRAEDVAACFTSGGIASRAVENAPGFLWLKLFINVAINPLTALLQVRNGALLDIPGVPEMMHRVVSEAEAVARARGIEVPCKDVMKKTGQISRATGANVSSMLQDIRAGRRTEIDFINGAVARLGGETGVPTPYNEVLAAAVKALEERAKLPPEKLPD